MKHPLRWLLVCLLSLLLAPSWIGALQSVPQTRWPNAWERGAYQVRIPSTGKILWDVRWETFVNEGKTGTRVEIQEDGHGTPWRCKEPLVWKKKMVFHTDPTLQFQSVEESRWTEKGKLLNQTELRVSPDRRSIFCADREMGKPPELAVVPWTAQILPDELLFHWARTLPFGPVGNQPPVLTECLLLVSPNRQFRLCAQVQGIETIKTPAGAFSCYRVALSPRLPGPLKALAPKMALWCAVEPPHFWVRYQGPVGGPGSPQATIELVEFQQGSE